MSDEILIRELASAALAYVLSERSPLIPDDATKDAREVLDHAVDNYLLHLSSGLTGQSTGSA